MTTADWDDDTWRYEVSIATDYAIALGRGRYCTRVPVDAKDPERYVVYLMQGGLGLPDEAYYREEQHAPVRERYRAHVARMLALSGNTGPYVQYAAARIRSIISPAANGFCRTSQAPAFIASTAIAMSA